MKERLNIVIRKISRLLPMSKEVCVLNAGWQVFLPECLLIFIVPVVVGRLIAETYYDE